MEQRWGDWLAADPAYNPNLTLDAEDFSLAWPPRGRAAPSATAGDGLPPRGGRPRSA